MREGLIWDTNMATISLLALRHQRAVEDFLKEKQ